MTVYSQLTRQQIIELHPEFVDYNIEEQKIHIRMPQVDENGDPELDENGDPLGPWETWLGIPGMNWVKNSNNTEIANLQTQIDAYEYENEGIDGLLALYADDVANAINSVS